MCRTEFKYLTNGVKLYMPNLLLLPRYELYTKQYIIKGKKIIFFEDERRERVVENSY